MIKKGGIFRVIYDNGYLGSLGNWASTVLVIQDAQVGQGFQPTRDFPPCILTRQAECPGGFQPLFQEGVNRLN